MVIYRATRIGWGLLLLLQAGSGLFWNLGSSWSWTW